MLLLHVYQYYNMYLNSRGCSTPLPINIRFVPWLHINLEENSCLDRIITFDDVVSYKCEVKFLWFRKHTQMVCSLRLYPLALAHLALIESFELNANKMPIQNCNQLAPWVVYPQHIFEPHFKYTSILLSVFRIRGFDSGWGREKFRRTLYFHNLNMSNNRQAKFASAWQIFCKFNETVANISIMPFDIVLSTYRQTSPTVTIAWAKRGLLLPVGFINN